MSPALTVGQSIFYTMPWRTRVREMSKKELETVHCIILLESTLCFNDTAAVSMIGSLKLE